MVQANGLATRALILLAMMAGPCGAAERQYSCKGQLIRGANPDVQPTPIDMNVTLGERNKLSLKTGEGAVLAPRTISDNKTSSSSRQRNSSVNISTIRATCF